MGKEREKERKERALTLAETNLTNEAAFSSILPIYFFFYFFSFSLLSRSSGKSAYRPDLTHQGIIEYRVQSCEFQYAEVKSERDFFE